MAKASAIMARLKGGEFSQIPASSVLGFHKLPKNHQKTVSDCVTALIDGSLGASQNALVRALKEEGIAVTDSIMRRYVAYRRSGKVQPS